MAQILVDRRDIDFVLSEQLEIENILEGPYAELNKKTIDLIIGEVLYFAKKEILPTCVDGDREGCFFENGKVTVPKSYHSAYKKLCDGGWLALSENIDYGGEGLPQLISCMATEILNAANMPGMTIGLTKGSARLIERLGTEEQKKLFLKKMYKGEWGGTMVLTESEAGTDVGAVATSAKKNKDDTYSITGNKIFITFGEHDLTENIIHLVLAHVEGSLKGIKGISLFIVPKIRVTVDGSLGKSNNVVCTGIEEKMGLHGSPTCSLSFGSKGGCQGFLLGEEGKGLKAMFTMMNEARFLVGIQGLSSASAAYMYALAYARERVQGKDLLETFNESAPSVSIINHPDVRRMLLTMKTYVEGMRSLLYYVAYLNDQMILSKEEGKNIDVFVYKEVIDFLTPIAKGYVTDKSLEVCLMAQQIYGGYGYIKDYPVEQLVRDCRITQIYEGTNGVQAMDLLGRKLGMVLALRGQIKEFVNSVRKEKLVHVERHVDKLQKAANKLLKVAKHMSKEAFSPNAKIAFSHAYSLMEVVGDVTMAWMLLWRASISAKRLFLHNGKTVKKGDRAFYRGQLKSAKFFVKNTLPLTMAKMDVILKMDDRAISISDDSFGGK